jgi:hypothetical protein
MESNILELTTENIESQKKKVFGKHPEVFLKAPCKIGDGVIQIDKSDQQVYAKLFDRFQLSSCVFIPASGSGSRMFQFLYDFLDQPNEHNRSDVERFLNHITDFAFFQQLPVDIRKKMKNYEFDVEQIVSYLLKKHGMGYGELPKGLIPFHKIEPFILTPFQEQVLQGVKVKEEDLSFHFTIQSIFEEAIKDGIKQAQSLTGQSYNVSFSNQDKQTNAIAFDMNQVPFFKDDGQILDRPAGHGALLHNLNSIESDFIFIKNIDNVQRFDKSDKAIFTWKVLGGILLKYNQEAKKVFQNTTIDAFIELNNKYQIVAPETIESLTIESIKTLLNRPSRVCGMVRNEGQPGGGPFWINDNGLISKQIVEKAQITMKGEQYRLMVQSTHFNPVMIVASTKDMDGNKFDLNDYKDDSKYFIVKKKFQGQDIQFMELPGLWNGSMAHWNSLFVEIPSTTFSPVKTILDLLDESHK